MSVSADDEELLRLEALMRQEFPNTSNKGQSYGKLRESRVIPNIKQPFNRTTHERINDFKLNEKDVLRYFELVENTPVLPSASTEFCSDCGKHPRDVGSQPQDVLRKCTGCHRVSYCSKACQKNNWMIHKVNCNTLTLYKHLPSSFKYTSLNSKTSEIRLLCVLPGNFDSSIRCNLVNANVGSASMNYEALSYAWGSQEDKKAIALNGKCFMVTSNLYAALQHLRHPKSCRNIWADAVCINQADHKEKGSQIQLMRQIYTTADHVIMWIGEVSHDSELAIRTIEKMADPVYEGMRYNPELVRRFGQLFLEDMSTSLALSRFASLRPYWERVWIVQEVIHARKVTVLCGQRTLSWDVLARATRLLKDYESGMYTRLGVFRLSWRHILSLVTITQQVGQEPSVLCYLRHMEHRDCYDPRDRVYAFLGLPCREDTSSFEVNYEATVEQVYTRFTMWHIKHTNSLNVLSYAFPEKVLPVINTSQLPSLYSWVPDLRRPAEMNLLSIMDDMFALPISNFRAGTRYTLPEDFFFDIDRDIDQSKGIFPVFAGLRVDRIKAIAPSFATPSKSARPDSDVMRTCIAMMQSIPEDKNPYTSIVVDTAAFSYVAHEGYPGAIRGRPNRAFIKTFHFRTHTTAHELRMIEAFWRTLLNDFVQYYVLPVDPDHSIAEERIIEDISGSMRPNRNLWPIWQYWYDQFRGEKPVQPANTIFADMIDATITKRSFMITEKGYMGVVTPQAKAGDLIVVFIGARVPQVLRPVEMKVYEGGDLAKRSLDIYQRVGDCYLHGMMNGEALQDFPDQPGMEHMFAVV